MYCSDVNWHNAKSHCNFFSILFVTQGLMYNTKVLIKKLLNCLTYLFDLSICILLPGCHCMKAVCINGTCRVSARFNKIMFLGGRLYC